MISNLVKTTHTRFVSTSNGPYLLDGGIGRSRIVEVCCHALEEKKQSPAKGEVGIIGKI